MPGLTDADGEMALLKTITQAGWPDTLEDVSWRVKDYFHYRDELAVQDGLILKGEKLVIPLSMREEIKQKLHHSHLQHKMVSKVHNLRTLWILDPQRLETLQQ